MSPEFYLDQTFECFSLSVWETIEVFGKIDREGHIDESRFISQTIPWSRLNRHAAPSSLITSRPQNNFK